MCDHPRITVVADVERTGKKSGKIHYLFTGVVRCSLCGMKMEFALPGGATATVLKLACRETTQVMGSQPGVVVKRGGLPDLDDVDDSEEMPAPHRLRLGDQDAP